MSRDGRLPLEAVVFDAGGTLLRLDFEWMAAALTHSGIPVEAGTLRRAEVEGRRRYDASRAAGGHGATPLGGPGDVRAYLGGMLEAAGVPHHLTQPTVTRFLAREKSSGLWSRPMEGAREAIDAMVGMGLRRAVVSNSDGRAETHLRNAGVLAGVEFVVDSHLVGVEKPDPAIFRIALERLGVAPGCALYVGDIRSVDEVGARAAGMHFVLIDPWGDYAAPDTPAVRAIADLARWVAARFEVPHASRSEAGTDVQWDGTGNAPDRVRRLTC